MTTIEQRRGSILPVPGIPCNTMTTIEQRRGSILPVPCIPCNTMTTIEQRRGSILSVPCIRCGTAILRICWRRERRCGTSRSCWAMRVVRRLKPTRSCLLRTSRGSSAPWTGYRAVAKPVYWVTTQLKKQRNSSVRAQIKPTFFREIW
jgi:ribosomal protein S27E